MMLLSAVVLIIAFVALTGMVARVSQLGKATARERTTPTLLAVEPMIDGVDRAIQELGGKYNMANATQVRAYQNATIAMLDHLQLVQAGQGYWVSYTLGCATPGDATTGRVTLSLDDGHIRVSVVSVTFTRPSCTTVTG